MLGGMARLIGALTRPPPLADHGPCVERDYSSPHSDGHDSNPRHPKRYDYRTRRGERDDEEQRTQNFPGAQGPVQVCLAEFAENRTFERSSLRLPNARPCRLTDCSKGTTQGSGRSPFPRIASGLSRAVGIREQRSGRQLAVGWCWRSWGTAAPLRLWPFPRTAGASPLAVLIRQSKFGMRPAVGRW